VIEGITHHGTGRPPPFYGPDGRRRVAEAAAFAARVLPVLARERFDVLDCASVPFLPLFSASLASRLRGGRLVATWFEYWDAYWLTYRGGTTARLAQLAERAAARAGDAHIAISSTTAARMAAHRPAKMPVAVIEPGVDVDFIEGVGDVDKSVDVVFSGRLNAQKNVELLLRALAIAEADGARITCGIVGDGPERERLAGMARDLGVGDRVQFHGRIEDDRDYFRTIKQARVFVWPSVAEGFGLAPLEAMACGVPPIVAASTFSATEGLAEGGTAGVVVEATPEAFAAAMRRLLADEPGLAAMRIGALARAKRSSWDAMAEAVERVYEDVVAGRPLRGH
jgi:glycosyltransferase involved in cell wall biosynthesis